MMTTSDQTGRIVDRQVVEHLACAHGGIGKSTSERSGGAKALSAHRCCCPEERLVGGDHIRQVRNVSSSAGDGAVT
jgi:hypothetical protein